MQIIHLQYPAQQSLNKRAHIGVAGSGDLELLIEPSTDNQAYIQINTSANGFEEIWRAVFDRFFKLYSYAVKIEINDFGATPGVVNLRLTQAMEVLHDEK